MLRSIILFKKFNEFLVFVYCTFILRFEQNSTGIGRKSLTNFRVYNTVYYAG